jgi:hypothetical protein
MDQMDTIKTVLFRAEAQKRVVESSEMYHQPLFTTEENQFVVDNPCHGMAPVGAMHEGFCEHEGPTEDTEGAPPGETVMSDVTVKTDNEGVSEAGPSIVELTPEQLAEFERRNVAYVSLENARKANLEAEFGKPVEDSECVACFRLALGTNSKGRFQSWARRKALPCLTCGVPVCANHRSTEFGKQSISICSDCAHLFSLEYIVTHIITEGASLEERQATMNRMLEVYDRALIVLKYSAQYIDSVASSLEQNTSRHNFVGLGSSATGVIAGGLGVAAAATIFTPVGPPLLLASILFGGGATAVNAGSEAVNYDCEPNKMADRIITLDSILTSINRLPAAMEMDEIIIAEPRSAIEQKQTGLHWRRTAMNVVKPLTAGALSAISILTEGRELKVTVDKIRAGSPCEKAKQLRVIAENVDCQVTTDALSVQLHIIMSRPQQELPEVLATPADEIRSETSDPEKEEAPANEKEIPLKRSWNLFGRGSADSHASNGVDDADSPDEQVNQLRNEISGDGVQTETYTAGRKSWFFQRTDHARNTATESQQNKTSLTCNVDAATIIESKSDNGAAIDDTAAKEMSECAAWASDGSTTNPINRFFGRHKDNKAGEKSLQTEITTVASEGEISSEPEVHADAPTLATSSGSPSANNKSQSKAAHSPPAAAFRALPKASTPPSGEKSTGTSDYATSLDDA